MVATGQEMVREKYSLRSGKCQGILLCSSRKYPYSPHGKLFVLHHPPFPPPGSSSLYSYISSTNLAFKTASRPPLGISNDLPWGGYGFFLGPYILGHGRLAFWRKVRENWNFNTYLMLSEVRRYILGQLSAKDSCNWKLEAAMISEILHLVRKIYLYRGKVRKKSENFENWCLWQPSFIGRNYSSMPNAGNLLAGTKAPS